MGDCENHDKEQFNGIGGLRAAKGGSEVGLGSVDRGGSCWW